MMIQKKVLGKGLDALIKPGSVIHTETLHGNTNELPIDNIEPNPYQPRYIMDDEKIKELSDSIKEHGVIQPVVVRKHNNIYQLIAGERRLRASKLAGLTKIPAVIIKANEEQLLEFAIIENVQREDLNAIEEAKGYNRLAEEFGYNQEEIAEKVGKNRTTVTNSLRLLKLSPEMQQDIIDGILTAGHARAILSLENKLLQMKLRDAIVNQGLSVRQAEKKAKEITEKKLVHVDIAPADPAIQNIENKLLEFFGVKTKIAAKTKSSGKIEIFYTCLEDFDRILEALNINVE